MSESIKSIELGAKKVLTEEGRNFSTRVKQNIRGAKLTKSGRTENSLREDVTQESLIVWGREDFQNIEKGISPQESKKVNFQQLKANIYNWSKYLPLNFSNTKERYNFAWNTSTKQNELGSLLFRKGGRKDIYSNELQPLYDSISDRIGKIIIQHKLL